MSTKEKIIESLTYIFENTKRIHGNSEAIDWIKVAIHKSAEYLSAQAFPVITKENDKQQKLSSIIHEVIWQYCFGKGDTDALFKYQDIGDATKEIVDQYFQPELSAQPDQGKEMKKPSNKDEVSVSDDMINKKIFELCSEMRLWDGKSSPKTTPELLFEFAQWMRKQLTGQ